MVVVKDVVDNLFWIFLLIKYSFFVGIGGGVVGWILEVCKVCDLRLGDVVVGWLVGEVYYGVV